MFKQSPTTRVYPSGMASFVYLALRYLVPIPDVHAKLKKKNLSFRLILEAPDFPPAAFLEFKSGMVFISVASPEVVADKSQWDGKLTAPSKILADYFTGVLPVIRPLVFRKIKPVGMLKLTKLIWFIKLNQKHLSGNKTFVTAVHKKMLRMQ